MGMVMGSVGQQIEFERLEMTAYRARSDVQPNRHRIHIDCHFDILGVVIISGCERSRTPGGRGIQHVGKNGSGGDQSAVRSRRPRLRAPSSTARIGLVTSRSVHAGPR